MSTSSTRPHAFGSPSDCAESRGLVDDIGAQLPGPADWLVDRVQFMFSFSVPYNQVDEHHRLAVDERRDVEQITEKAKAAFPGEHRAPRDFNNQTRLDRNQPTHQRRIMIRRGKMGCVEITGRLTLSPIRQLRCQFFPNSTATDFSGNDNFLPELPGTGNYDQMQHAQLQWITLQYREMVQAIKSVFPEAVESWVKCTSIEVVWDYDDPEPSPSTEELSENLDLILADCTSRASEQFQITKGRANDADLGVYKKTENKGRLQLTLDHKTKPLAKSGQHLRTKFDISALLKDVLGKYLDKFIVEALRVGNDRPPLSSEVTGINLATLLRRMVPASAAHEIAIQHTRNGQIKFQGKFGHARTTLKKIGAIREVGKGIYKLTSFGELEKLAREAASQDLVQSCHTTLNDQSSPASLIPLDIALSKVDSLSWEQRLSTFAWLVLPGLKD